MAVLDWAAPYLGTIADIDTGEPNAQAEDPNALIGTYGSAGSPLNATRTVITTTSDEDDAFELDHGVANTPDTVEYDIGAGPVTTQLDTVALVDGTDTFDDGTTMTGTFGVVQDATAALFLTISDSQTTLAGKPGENLEITSIVTTSFAGASQTTRDDLQFVCFAEGTLIATPRGPVAERMFGTREVMLPARHLVGLPGVRRAAVGAGVAYFTCCATSVRCRSPRGHRSKVERCGDGVPNL